MLHLLACNIFMHVAHSNFLVSSRNFCHRHLQNFVLLFASNVENLMAYIFSNIMNQRLLHWIEVLLGVIYLVFVVNNLLWFVNPLKEREEYELLLEWGEDKLDDMKNWCIEARDSILPWRRNEEGSLLTNCVKSTMMAAARFKSTMKKKKN